eukprot:CAMPEP_0181113552 /NCGR_PEP_ID=MMETSP1071-20121207/20409_1 /TAXON_ID=35127 /ORGANISM="Thalassiosira sp., Strain NH16" /LENGTH=420 /DNA_ID=CAMNT_0023197599 /DNA_START=199 /DNA_END=1458 /DNA_ORIENTATION=+
MSANTNTESKGELPTKIPAPVKQAKKSKKRKRGTHSKEDQYEIQSIDRFKKLHHACSKQLHREAKVVKSFECQKIVRAIKAAKVSLDAQVQQDNDDDRDKKEAKNSSKALKRLESLQHKLDCTKKIDLSVLVQVGLKRLGVLGLDPQEPGEAPRDADESNEKDRGTIESLRKSEIKEPSQSEDPFYQALLESMLRHKRLSAALDQLNEKVSEHRQWTMHCEAILQSSDNTHEIPTVGKKKKKHKNQQGNKTSGDDTMVVAGGFKSRNRGIDLGGHEGASGLFIGSLSGMQADGYGGEHDMDGNGDYGEEDYYEHQQEKKKNRPGQRARRAKAQAIEARKSGKTWDSSSNWREKKKERREERVGMGRSSDNKLRGGESRRNESGGSTTPKDAQHIAAMGKVWKEDGNAHPSWAAAAAAQKS